MSVTTHPSTDSLGTTLERDRLERRLRRATVAVADLEAQIQAISARLQDLDADRGVHRIERVRRAAA
jgi:division protein CdvB (Snf7/Vps24/ESCRT-III family)